MKGLRKRRFEILTILVGGVLFASTVYALTYLWSAPSTVAITTEVQNIVVLNDIGEEITSINFGSINPGSTINVKLIVKNTSPNVSITITWSSTLSSITNKITDWWREHSPSGNSLYETLDPGESITTYYGIKVASDCPLESYSWTLYITPG
ncbi:MAG: hypothetical protein ACTSV7_00740 [Candidatus Baldrarchaeia archaeon]